MIFPEWLETTIDLLQQSTPIFLLMLLVAFLWWRWLHPAR
jgi:hypothetical protein